MRRFRFSLAKIERLRLHKERLARRELAERLAALAAVDEEISVVEANLEVCRRDGGPLGEAMVEGLGRRRRELTERRERAAEEVDRARVDWLARRRERMALTKLHERRLAEWRAEADRHERAVMDEVAGNRHARRNARREA